MLQHVQLYGRPRAGSGFTSIAGIFLAQSRQTLITLTATDRLISSGYRDTYSLSESQLETVRCTAHHRLLSLPAWDDLDGETVEWADETVYESCWWTATLYSDAVALGLPRHTGWHVLICHAYETFSRAVVWWS